jgi:thiol:disulfide interchange protein
MPISNIKTVVRIALLTIAFAGTFAISNPRAWAGTRVIYNETADAHADIQQAIATAAKEHKRVILDFGGNWCGDCQVLDIYFHDDKNRSLLESSYVLVHVNICRMDCNTDIAEKYGVPLAKGVPGLAVLDGRGRVIYSQKNGEFEAMRRMDESSVTEFLNKWKP